MDDEPVWEPDKKPGCGCLSGEEVLASTIGDLCAAAFDSAVTDGDT